MFYDAKYWTQLASALLAHHFGLTLNDTNLGEASVVNDLIGKGVQPFEAVNELVDRYELTRLNQNTYQPRSPYLTAADQLMASLDIEKQNPVNSEG